MSIRREFVDWNRPLIPQVAGTLFGAAEGAPADLRRQIVLLPGERARRLLLGHLLVESAKSNRGLLPPRTLTASHLIELIVSDIAASSGNAQQATASATESHLAWSAALRELPDDVVLRIMPDPPAADDHPAWARLARMVGTVHHQLAAGMRSFQDVARIINRRSDVPAEVERWSAMLHLERSYHANLRRIRKIDGDVRAAAMLATAAERSIEPLPDHTLAIVGVSEMSILERAAVALFAGRAVSYVHADDAIADAFDDFGCVDPEQWAQRPIDLPEDVLHVCERAADQAQVVIASIAAVSGHRAASEVTIGVGDESLASAIQQQCAWAGVATHIGSGRPLSESPPVQLLRLIADWLDEPRFACLGALIRHPDFESSAKQIAERSLADAQVGQAVYGWVNLLDRYFEESLQQRFTGTWLGRESDRQQLGILYDAVCDLLKPVSVDERRPLSQWCEPIVAVLSRVHGKITRDARPYTFDASVALREVLLKTFRAAEQLQPTCSAGQAIRWLLDAVEHTTVPDVFHEEQVEMLGWLELHADTAPVQIITGMNDGLIPSPRVPDPFLPDSLRAQLGLSCQSTRHARDAYLLAATTMCRDSVQLISARLADDEEPLAMSQLLYQCDEQTLLERVRQFHAPVYDSSALVRPTPIGVSPPREVSNFTVPTLPEPLLSIDAMRVTDFKHWLECPYRFALARILRLKSYDALPQPELPGSTFGTLLHKVLESFANEPAVCDSDDIDEIEAFLLDVLKSAADSEFGHDRSVAMCVQLAQAEQRLRAFAAEQVRLRQEGWKIVHAELQLDGEATQLAIPGQPPMPIKGRVDRVDRHTSTGRYRLIDYKTGDRATDPLRAHHRKSKVPDPLEWFDLQLPLYHHLLAQCLDIIPEDSEIELAYILLPRKMSDAGTKTGNWTPAQLEHGISKAREVVQEIRSGQFSMHDPPAWDDFKRICQSTVVGVPDAEEGN